MFEFHSPAFAADLVATCKVGLQQSRLHSSEVMVIYADTLTDPAYAAAFWAAAKELGADVFQVTTAAMPINRKSRVENRATVGEAMLAALKDADMVLDISNGGLLYSDSREQILKGGGRILRVREPWDILKRLPPTEAVRDRTVKGAARLAQANRIRVWGPNGTDFTVERRDRVTECQYGAADQPGRWDHWPSGMIYCAPVEETLNGRLVIDRGDLLFPPNLYVREPLHCEFRNGVLESMEGGTDAVLFKEYLFRSGERNARRMAHLGWGTEHRARWEMFSIRGSDGGGSIEARSAYGNVLLALGENRDLGGQNAAPVHSDIALRRASLELDGELIVEDGRIVAAGLG
jgi:2,5-dihydroxypyridine 5,6-dioxygenase